MNKTFAELLDTYVEKSGLKQEDVGKKAGCGQAYVSRLINNTTSPPPYDTLKKISKVLSLSKSEHNLIFEATVRERMFISCKKVLVDLYPNLTEQAIDDKINRILTDSAVKETLKNI